MVWSAWVSLDSFCMILDTFCHFFLMFVQYVYVLFHSRYNLDVLGFCLGMFENVLGVLGYFRMPLNF